MPELRLEKPLGGAEGPEAPRVAREPSLPTEVVRAASRRLGWAGLVYAVTYFLAYFGSYFAGLGAGIMPGRLYEEHPVEFVTAIVAILLGLGTFWLSRRSRLAPARLLDLGLVFEVVGALAISVSEFWGSDVRVEHNVYVGISWTCVWIIIFPILAPSTPVKTAIAAFLAASMPLVARGVSVASGMPVVGPSVSSMAVYFLFTTYLCAALAYVIARIIHRFGVRLREALEVGSYRLVTRLGQGGMGEVWRAEHRLLARPAAVKLIRLGAADPTDREAELPRRFEREARATSALRSVHTVELYDFGVTDDGRFYYVMELLDGLSFDRLVDRFGPVPAGRTIYLLRQVCHSLGEAHERGMIHRDVKPGNLMTCRLGPDVDFVKVLDFGLVKLQRESESGDVGLTGENRIAGTPAFLAPELALGDGPADGRADLYALGCVAYWLLTGHHVFEGGTAMAVVFEHLRAEPEPPSRRTELEIPADVERLVLRCLEKDPDRRPGSAAELDSELAACTAAAEWGPERAKAWWRLHVPDGLGTVT